MQSIWETTAQLPQFDALSVDRKTDVLIIGGGITGILCAYLLTQAGTECMLVEQGRLCQGITSCTTAKITSQHGLLYDKLIRRIGVEKAKLYLRANQAALEKYRTLCENIDCNYEETDAFVYSLHDKEILRRELAALKQLDFPASYVRTLPLPFATVGGVRFARQAQFHPLRFLSTLAEGLRIYESTKVLELLPDRVRTEHASIYANRIIVATHFPFLNQHGSYFLKLYQQRSYVLALKNASLLPGAYIDASGKGLSFRSFEDLLLLGGGSHRTGKQSSAWKTLTDFAARHYPQAEEVGRWATQDCMTLDGVPYIGQYSKYTPNVYVATGFNKWGMTSAMVAAMLLTELVQGKQTPYASVFSPSRTILRPQLAINGFEAVTGLLTPSKPRCPHLGCALKWNRQEHSWDCSCHGSRFSANGTLLDNPATGNKQLRL